MYKENLNFKSKNRCGWDSS